ncbi:hypothetical protein BDB01DRAFT_756772 [Pilobolus umbonatus]|nr:hypothetical protein BDB01DRAFT_756772 [Pilobolus umbonatus]
MPRSARINKRTKNISLKEGSSADYLIQKNRCRITPFIDPLNYCRACCNTAKYQKCCFIKFRAYKLGIDYHSNTLFFPSTTKPDMFRTNKSQRFQSDPCSSIASQYVMKHIQPLLKKYLNQDVKPSTPCIPISPHTASASSSSTSNTVACQSDPSIRPIRREHISGTRDLCDICCTNIFNLHHICSICGLEICQSCFQSFDELENKKAKKCTRRRVHTTDHFLLFSKYSEETLHGLNETINIELDCVEYDKSPSIESLDAQDKKSITSSACLSPAIIPNSTANRSHHSSHLDLIPNKLVFDTEEAQPYLPHMDMCFDDIFGKKNELGCSFDKSNLLQYEDYSHNFPVHDDGLNTINEYNIFLTNDIPPESCSLNYNNTSCLCNNIFEPSIDNIYLFNNLNYFNTSERQNIDIKHCTCKSTIDTDHHSNTLTTATAIESFHSSLSSSSPTLNLTSSSPHDFLVASAATLTLTQFQENWKQHKIAVIYNSLAKSKMEWTPDYLIQHYGDESVLITDCHDDTQYRTSLVEYLEAFKDMDKREEFCQGLNSSRILEANWPDMYLFEKICPELYNDFMSTLPAPDYCTANGYLNLINRLPEPYLPPDLGPKLMISYGSDGEMTGKSNLECNVADMTSLMYYTEPHNYCAASIWYIFPPHTRSELRHFLMKKYEPPYESRYQDPIYNQSVYLSDTDLCKLKEATQIEPWIIYQNPGDAIYIPAGSPYQVRNNSSSIKCAYGFISPENLQESELVTEEFRVLQKEDILQLPTTLLYAWGSLLEDQKKLHSRKRKPSVSLNTSTSRIRADS